MVSSCKVLIFFFFLGAILLFLFCRVTEFDCFAEIIFDFVVGIALLSM